MSRQLLIMRHAKSAWDTDARTDFERPLAKRGKKDAPRVGRWLRQRGLVPDLVVSSPARRAKQTALEVCKELGLAKARVKWELSIYEGDTDGLLNVLESCPADASTVLLVGHNPGLEMLITYLCGCDIAMSADSKLMPTAAVAQLEMPKDWGRLQSETARLVSIVRPRSLPQE